MRLSGARTGLEGLSHSVGHTPQSYGGKHFSVSKWMLGGLLRINDRTEIRVLIEMAHDTDTRHTQPCFQ